VDARTLAEAKVEGGVLVHGQLRWRVVVLPCADTLPLAAWENLARFWREGGVVISLGALPANSETEFPSARVQALSKEIFGAGEGARVLANAAGGAGIFLPSGSEALLLTALNQVLEPDLAPAAADSPLRATHRRIDGSEVYFIINDSSGQCDDTVAVAAEGKGELWDPATGTVSPLPGPAAKLSLGAYGGVLLRFPSARTPRRLQVRSGTLPGLRFSSLPATQPSVGKGEFVRAELTPDDRRGEPNGPAWRAVGTLTKGQVDTFLFLTFQYGEPVDLSEADSLVLDTWVPEAQRTSAEFLVIMSDKDGGDYIASSGRSLAAPGHWQSFVPLSGFALAGWSKDPDGRLDLTRIARISIGWGGYYGTEGEAVEFSLSPPRLAATK
jgi:hypothetical protein